MTQLDPDLLRACAAYLAHEHVYRLADVGELAALLRADARRLFLRDTPDDKCDEVTRAHLNAIRRYAQDHLFITGQQEQRHVPVARAILDATPDMLAWWCERLGEGESSS